MQVQDTHTQQMKVPWLFQGQKLPFLHNKSAHFNFKRSAPFNIGKKPLLLWQVPLLLCKIAPSPFRLW